MRIDPLLVVERDLIAVPVAVHEVRIIVAAARIGCARHLPRRALNLEAPLRSAQTILVVSAEEVCRALWRLAADIDKEVRLLSSRTAYGEIPLAVLAVDAYAECPIAETAAVHVDIAAVVPIAAHCLPIAREVALLRPFRIEIDGDRLSAVRAVIRLHRAGKRCRRTNHHICAVDGIRHRTGCHDEKTRHVVEIHCRTVRKHPARGEVRLDERGAHAQRRYIREDLIHVARRRRERIEVLRCEALRRIWHLHYVPITHQTKIRLFRMKPTGQISTRKSTCVAAHSDHRCLGQIIGVHSLCRLRLRMLLCRLCLRMLLGSSSAHHARARQTCEEQSKFLLSCHFEPSFVSKSLIGGKIIIVYD